LGDNVLKKLDHGGRPSVVDLRAGFMAQEVLAGIALFW
jgi:hypothetical protein